MPQADATTMGVSDSLACQHRSAEMLACSGRIRRVWAATTKAAWKDPRPSVICAGNWLRRNADSRTAL